MKLPTIINQKEVDTIIHHATSFRYGIAFQLMAYCGLRISEVASLKASDINIKEKILKVVQGKRGKDRFVPIPQSLIHNLKVYIDYNIKEDLFPVSKVALWSAFKKAVKKAGLSSDITPHTMRHFYATSILEKTNSLTAVKELLGHADIKTTQIYTHMTTETKRKAVNETFK